VIRDVAGNPALDAAGMIQYKLDEGLLTRQGVSESVKGGEVLASIILFGVIYALLFAIWIYVLNDKIQKGPQLVHAADHTTTEGVLDVSSDRALRRESMSEAKDESEEV
jgi:cytochrome bd ubiquinol oxidase subunit I